jgi:transposase
VLTLPSTVRVYVATQPTDLRKGFHGLSLAVTSVLDHDPLSGHLFCFFNRRATMVRILFWDRSGWCIISKRLARGRFRLAELVRSEEACVEMDAAELSLIMEGIDLSGAKRRRRFRLLPRLARAS